MNGERKILGPRDPRRKPLSELLMYAWQRYHRPLIIGETSGYQDRRAEWLRMTVEESLKALHSGIDLQGICLYPCVDIPDWNTGEWAQIGIYDVQDRETLERCPCDSYIGELRRWERLLHEPERVELYHQGEPGSRVRLGQVRRYATEWAARATGGRKVKNTVPQAP